MSTTVTHPEAVSGLPADVALRIARLLAEHPPESTEQTEFFRYRFAAGLARIEFPPELGGLGLDAALQDDVDAVLDAAGAPPHYTDVNPLGLALAGPTILGFGSDQQKAKWFPRLWTGEDVWCQLFSEPDAGSDLASLSTRAVRDGDEWVVNGRKVWNTYAHDARWGLLVARTDPSAPKHRGLTYFVCDMTDPGVQVSPIRQITGVAGFNEVLLTDARIPDDYRIGAEGDGWKVARGTLANERVAFGRNLAARGSGPISDPVSRWREEPDCRSASHYERLLDLWVAAESLRLTTARLVETFEAGAPGPEGSAIKLAFGEMAQGAASLSLDLAGAEGLRYDDWEMRRPEDWVEADRHPAYAYLRTRANSIEGGTSEILRNVIAERILGLPPEPREDVATPWKDTQR